jgi:hypothetical protein
VNQVNAVCDAMVEAGIIDPNSQSGIDFCTNCPYPEDCVLFADGLKKVRARTGYRVMRAKKLLDSGRTIEDIADIMGKSQRQIARYLGGRYGRMA